MFSLSCHSVTEKVIKNVDEMSSKKSNFEYSNANLFFCWKFSFSV